MRLILVAAADSSCDGWFESCDQLTTPRILTPLPPDRNWRLNRRDLKSVAFLVLFQEKNEMKKGKYPYRNIYFFAEISICLTSKISKEIWKMVIWSEYVFKENLMLQFSWLEKFRHGKVSRWWILDELQYENGLKDQF